MKYVDVEFLDPRWARIQATLSRGDERLCEILIKVAKLGASLSAWNAALRRAGLHEEYSKGLDPDGELPWNFIDLGVPLSELKKEYEKARSLL